MRKPIKEIEIEGDDEAHTIMQVAQRLPPHCLLYKIHSTPFCIHGDLNVNPFVGITEHVYIASQFLMKIWMIW